VSHETYGLEAIVKHPAEVLRTPAARITVPELDKYAGLFADLKRLVREDAGSVGLAAPQLGVSVRACALKLNADGTVVVMVNPKIVERRYKPVQSVEGCFSLDPEDRVNVRRHEWVAVSSWDAEGRRQPLRLKGLPARAAQHEIDHLNGVLIIDIGAAYRVAPPPDEGPAS
jgi:peptide deformylase